MYKAVIIVNHWLKQAIVKTKMPLKFITIQIPPKTKCNVNVEHCVDKVKTA